MDGARRLPKNEVVQESAAPIDRLGAHPCGCRDQVMRFEVRHEPAERACERSDSEGAVHFSGANAPVVAREAAKTRESHEPDELPAVDVAPGVTLPGEGQHSIRPGMHASVDAACEVDSEKRKLRVGDRIDEVAHEVPSRGHEFVELASKRNNPHVGVWVQGTTGHLVGVQPGTVHDESSLECAACGLDRDGGWRLNHIQHALIECEIAARSNHERRQRPAHLAEVNDAGVLDMERCHAGGVGLQLTQLVRTDAPRAHAIRVGSIEEIVKWNAFRIVQRDDQLAAAFMRYLVLGTKLHHCFRPGDRCRRFERTGSVVDAGVDHPRIPAALVRGDAILFVDDQDGEVGSTVEQGVGSGEPDDSSADHDNVDTAANVHAPVLYGSLRSVCLLLGDTCSIPMT